MFSLSDEASFHSIYNYYRQLVQYRNVTSLPLMLVGTQGNSIFKLLISARKFEHRNCFHATQSIQNPVQYLSLHLLL